tara:strand:+ start:29 stop:337 length:309 start_codon:yes stop_codon:yes gene_type:complete
MHMSKVDMRIALQSMMSIQREAGCTISRILDGVVPERYMGKVKLGSRAWHCGDSPVLICVYDTYPGYLECIYCNLTQEDRENDHQRSQEEMDKGDSDPHGRK